VAIAADRVRPVGGRLSRVPSQILDRLNDWDESIRRIGPVNRVVRFVQAPVTREIQGSRFLVGPAVLGFIATLLVTIGALQPGSNFVLERPQAWFFGVSSSGGSTGRIFFGLLCVYAGIILFVRVWLGVVKALSNSPGVSVRKLAWLLLIWALPVVLAPPLFSHDIYSYAAQGEMVTRHINPYVYSPSTLGANGFTNLVDNWWINSPSPYGPLFLQIAGVFTSLSGHNVLADLVLLRLLALAGVGLIAFSLPSLTRSIGRDAGLAFGLAVLNPVTIFHLIGGAHNDALMIGLLVSGLALAKRNHRVMGIVLCALAASVKAPAAIGIIYIAWEWVGRGVPFKERVRPLVTSVLIGGTVMGALSLATGLGWGWILDLSSADAVRSWLAPATGSGLLITDVLHGFGAGVSLSGVLTVTRVLGLVAAGIVCLVLLKRSDRMPELRALGLSLMLVVILSPVVQPWYLSWGIVLLSPVVLPGSRTRRVMIGLSIAAVVVGLPDGQLLVKDLVNSSPLVIAGALVVLLGVLLAPLGNPGRSPAFRERASSGGREPLIPAGMVRASTSTSGADTAAANGSSGFGQPRSDTTAAVTSPSEASSPAWPGGVRRHRPTRHHDQVPPS
jgi:alpha-1,6-mannosyltransferase